MVHHDEAGSASQQLLSDFFGPRHDTPMLEHAVRRAARPRRTPVNAMWDGGSSLKGRTLCGAIAVPCKLFVRDWQ